MMRSNLLATALLAMGSMPSVDYILGSEGPRGGRKGDKQARKRAKDSRRRNRRKS
jgi:hypothetical protein